MLLCTEESDDVDEVEQTSHKKEKKFVFNHGSEYIQWLNMYSKQ